MKWLKHMMLILKSKIFSIRPCQSTMPSRFCAAGNNSIFRYVSEHVGLMMAGLKKWSSRINFFRPFAVASNFPQFALQFLRATAAIAVTHFSHCNTVCLSVCSSVCSPDTRVDQPKPLQAKITKFLPSAAWKTLVSVSVKTFHKFHKGRSEQGRWMRGGWEKFAIFSQ